jgi:hypothetical protein
MLSSFYEVLGILVCGSVVLFLPVFCLFCTEQCFLTTCLKEYEGTYDETQEEVVAADWSYGFDEDPHRDDLMREVELIQEVDEGLARELSEEDQLMRYHRQERLSSLRYAFKDLSYQHFKVSKMAKAELRSDPEAYRVSYDATLTFKIAQIPEQIQL